MIRPNNKKNIFKNIKSHMLLILFLCVGIFVFDANTVSASTHLEEQEVELVDGKVGRYELNYTGNTNHFTTWYESGDVNEQYIYNDLGSAYFNSSSAYLNAESSSSTIKYAFLVWQSRTTEKEGFAPMEAPVKLILPNGTDINISPQYIIKDDRDNWDGQNHDNYGSVCTMVTDVTSIVKQAGFGKYSVCNIPMWEPSPASMLSNGTYPAGESPGSWQLVIVEESRNFNVKAVSLSVTSEFHLATDFTGNLVLENGLKSTTTGDANGQFLFGMVRSDETASVTEYINTKDSHGNVLRNALGQTINKAGLYRNGAVQNNRDSANGGVCVDLSDISNIGSGATSAELYVRNDTLWTAFTMLGASFDISYPDFEGIQTTTVNDDVTEVTVEGSFKNIAISADTGIYDGNLEIIVDPQLTPISATAKVNGTIITTVPTINGNVVKFSGSEVRNMMNGDDISYTVLCTANSAGAIKYENEARFNGKLRSEGANTGYWVDQIWVASSEWEREVYQITLNNQGATTAGTSCYFEWYNHGNYTTEGCINAIDTIVAPTKDNYIFDGYFTGVNGTGTKYVDADGRILSDATTFTANTTLYACWIPKIYKITLDNQGAGSGKEGTLCYYEKYGVGNYTDEACTTPITQIILPVKDGYTFEGYWTKTGGDSGGGIVCITTAGKVMTSSTLFTADTTIYADWESQIFTITCDNQGATYDGSTRFYEQYTTCFYYDEIVMAQGTTSLDYGYTGGVQSFIAPYSGTYFIDVYGAQGSSCYGLGGYGGRSYGVVTLEQGECIYIYVGGQGSGQEGAGWNGGSAGESWLWGVGAGGGATDVRRGNTALANRIIVAGGGGGGVATPNNANSAQGGAGGGTTYQPVNIFAFASGYQPQDPNGYFGPFVNSYDGYAPEYAPAGAGTASGQGGGGGYTGGRTKVTVTGGAYNIIPAGEGGTGYIGGVTAGNVGGTNYGVASLAGQKTGDGHAVITRSNYTTKVTQTTKINPPQKEGYYFRGYYTGKNGTGVAVTDAKGNILVAPDYFAGNTTVYAHWSTKAAAGYTIVYDGNGATEGAMPSVTVPLDANYVLNRNLYERMGYTFAGWSSSPTGKVEFADKEVVYNLVNANQTKTLYAVWTPIKYTIRFNGNGETSGSMQDMFCNYGKEYTLPQLEYEKVGYHFTKWTTNQDGTGTEFTDGQSVSSLTSIDGAIVNLYAQWEANSYTIMFHPNDGGALIHIEDVVAQYGTEIALPNGADFYVKYTLNGENVTDAVLSGALSMLTGEETAEESETLLEEELSVEESETLLEEEIENVQTVAEEEKITAPAQKIYPSVFLGWALEEGKNRVTPQWNVGEAADVSVLADAAGVTNQNGAVIILYAVWDDCPWIQATDLYYTLEQAQSGYITQEEILSHATASDREDGSPIAPGFHENGTSFSIPDYLPADFTQFQNEGSSTENLTVVDSAGNMYVKQITVYVVDTTPVAVEPEGTTRFINEYYYNQPYENGGLEENSIWLTNPEYVAAIQETFDNIRNDTAIQTYYFTHEEIEAMKMYIAEHGIGNSKETDALQQFYNEFMTGNVVLH